MTGAELSNAAKNEFRAWALEQRNSCFITTEMIELGCWYFGKEAQKTGFGNLYANWQHVEQDGYKFDVILIQKESERGTNNAFIILPNGKAFLQSDVINTTQRTLKEWQELYDTI